MARPMTEFKAGDRVRWKATEEEGVVLAAAGEFLEVNFPSGRILVHPDELEPVPRDPAERLAAGELRGPPWHIGSPMN